MEPFLPSEVARLVYGYLEEAKCDRAAQSFLENSPHLSECLAVNKEGRGFNTKPSGYSLTDILDEFCEIRSIVAEHIQKLPKNLVEKLQRCDSVIRQLRYLIDATQSGQTLLVSINIPPQESSIQGNRRSITSAQNQTSLIDCADRVKRTAIVPTRGIKQQSSNDGNERATSVSNSMLSVEATPLEVLPGISEIVDNQSVPTEKKKKEIRKTQNISADSHTTVCEHVDHDLCSGKSSKCFSNQCKKCNKMRIPQHEQHSPSMMTSPAIGSQNSSLTEDGSPEVSAPKQKHICSSKRKSANPTPVKGHHTPMKIQTPSKKVRRSHSDDNESSENFDLSVLTRALLDNTELHKKIAENINKAIHKPVAGETSEKIESVASTNTAGDTDSAEIYPMMSSILSCDGILQELNQTIKTIVDQTEQDPVFERFLEDIIGPIDDDMTPSPVELQTEDDDDDDDDDDDAVPDPPVTTKQAKNVDMGSHCSASTANKKSTSLSSATVTSSSKDEQRPGELTSDKLSNDVPLKQRLRSAKLQKSDAASGVSSASSSSLSEKEKESPSLEDQNAAAVQCIVDAHKLSQVTHNHQPGKEIYTDVSVSTTDTRTVHTVSPIDSCQGKLSHPSSQLIKDISATVGSLQKETIQTSGSTDGSLNPTEVANDPICSEVILLDGNLMFLDNNASFSLSTETSSSFVSNSAQLATQLSNPLVVTSQPSAYKAGTSQVMAIAIPGGSDSGATPLYPTPQCLVTTNVIQDVGTFAFPGSQNVTYSAQQQTVLPMSTVIMCGNDGLIPQLISVKHQESVRKNCILPGSSGGQYVPIASKDALVSKATTSCQDPSSGTSNQANPTTSWSKNHVSSTGENKAARNRNRDLSHSKVSASYPDNSGDEAKLMCSNTEQQNSSFPSVVPASSQTVDSVTPQEGEWEKLLGALNLKEAHETSLNSKLMDTAMYSKSMKAKSDLILQNVDKYPASPQLMTLVNLTRNLANSECSPSAHTEGTDRQCSEMKVAHKFRDTPQRTIFQGRTDTNSRRMSLSTPRRQKHVRALDFTTPTKARTIPKDLCPKEPPPQTIENLSKILQRTTNNTVNKARSSLFKSPLSESEKATVSSAPLLTTVSLSDSYHNNVPPIATRSPVPYLSGGWDSAAGVGQIICDDVTLTGQATLGSHSSGTATRDEKNLSTKRTSHQQNRQARRKATRKLADGSSASSRSLACPKKSWDSDLRACVKADFVGVQLSTNDSGSTKRNTRKKKTKTSKSRRKSSQKTRVKIGRLKEQADKDANMGSGSINLNQESTNGESGNILSSSVIPVSKSYHSSEKSGLATEAATQNRDLNTESVVQVKGKSGLEPASESGHTHVQLKEKLVVKFSGEVKKCVSVDALIEKKDSIQPTDLQDSQVTRDRESDGENQGHREIAASKNDDLSKSSDLPGIETASCSTPVVSVVTEVTLPAEEPNTTDHQNLHTLDAEMCVVRSDDPGDDTDTVARVSGMDRELTDGTVSATDDPVSQNQKLVSSASEVHPAESENRDVQTPQDYESVSGKEQSFTKVENNPPLKTSRTQKQTHDAVNKSDLQVRSMTAPNLDTPRKTDDPHSTCWRTEFAHVPLTPRMMSPRPDDTPVTKVANGNSRIDFSLIQTPSFPPTPNIAVTPESCCSSQGTPPSYATRSADCSSYYKPSDRQGACNSTKPLEQLLIEECRKLENRAPCAHKENTTSESTDVGQCQDKTEEATPLSELQTTRHVESGKAVEELVGVPKTAASPQDRNRAEETQKVGETDCSSSPEPEPGEMSISTGKETGSVLSSGNRDNAVKDRPSARVVSLNGNESSDFEGKSSGSTRRKSLSISKRSNFEDELSETCINSASLSAEGNSVAVPKTGNRSRNSEATPSGTHDTTTVSTMRKSRASNKSSDYNKGPHAATSVTTKGKRKPISRRANKSSELPGTQRHLYEEPDEKTKDEIIQKHLEAAWTKVFGATSPSDDSDFESSNDFGQSEAESKTQSCTGQEKRNAIHSIYTDDSSSDTQQMVASGEENPVRSELAQVKEKSPFVQASVCGAQIRKSSTDENVNCETAFCHSESPADHNRTSLTGKNTSSKDRLDEEKHYMIAESKEVDVPSSMPKDPIEQGDEATTAIGSSNSANGIGARKQPRDSAKTATNIASNRKNDAETGRAMKTSHLCVEAIAERLTKEKVSGQAHPKIQTAICEPVTCEDSTSEDFPALHLSSDEDTQCEVESQVANLHGGEETSADRLAERSPPRSAHDVRRDLERTPTKLCGVASGPTLLQADTGQKQLGTNKRKKWGGSLTSDCRLLEKGQGLSERQDSTIKKIRALLGSDVSPIKIVTGAKKASRGKKHEILSKPPTDAGKDNSPIASTLEMEWQGKKLEETLRANSAVSEMGVLSKQNKAPDSNKIKEGTKSLEARTNEENDSVEFRTAVSVQSEGMASLDAAVMYKRHQVSDNEVYIGIVYADEGPKGNSLAFEDIRKFSLTFELGEDSDGVAETYKCTVSEFQELFYASPRQCTSESDSCESGQFDVRRKLTASTCKEDKHVGYVKNSEVRGKKLFCESRSVGHETRSQYPNFRRSTDFPHHRTRSPQLQWRSSSLDHRRQAFSSSEGRRSQSLSRRSPPSSSASSMSTFSPLNHLYSEYLVDERESGRFTSNFRSREKFLFGKRGKGQAKHHGRRNHSRSPLVHSSKKSSHTPSSHGMYDSHHRIWKHSKEHRPAANRMSTQQGKPIESCSRKLSADTASAKDAGRERTETGSPVDREQDIQDTDESLEEGELVDEDSMQGLSKYKCNDNQKYPSSVGSGNAARNLNRNTSADMVSDQSLDQRGATQEPEETPKQSVTKQAASGRALPPKKRRTSSEEISLHAEKRMRTDGPQALLKKVDLDNLLDFVHGEKQG